MARQGRGRILTIYFRPEDEWLLRFVRRRRNKSKYILRLLRTALEERQGGRHEGEAGRDDLRAA